MSFEDPSVDNDGSFYEESQGEQYQAQPQYETSSPPSPFDAEVDAALRTWFDGRVGSILRPIHEYQVHAQIKDSVGAFESSYELTKQDMNAVLETALGFGENVVNSMPTAQLLDYAYRVWSGAARPAQRVAPTRVAASKEKDRFASSRDTWNDANAAFEEMLAPASDQHQRLTELRDRDSKRARGTLTKFDEADASLARRYREQR